MGSSAGNPNRGAESEARDLVRSLAAIRGAAATLVREQASLSAEQLTELLSIIGDQSTLAVEILRRAVSAACGEGAGVDGVLARLVAQDAPLAESGPRRRQLPP